MIATPSLLVALWPLIDRLPLPAYEAPRRRGRPVVYSDRLCLKALVVMIVRRLTNVHLLYTVLQQPIPEMEQVRAALSEHGHLPCRRTFERRLRTLPGTLPAQIVELGRYLVMLLQTWPTRGLSLHAVRT